MKQYNGEKAIISLTTWKARINTVGLTLFSLYKKCPGFHKVLVLSEEEFPQKEAELPDSVMAFVDQDLIEILWVYKNYKSFKKVLFTMEKYKSIPVISADDDCLYTCNYAQKLYDSWCKNKNHIITNHGFSSGYGIIFPPNLKFDTTKITDAIIATNNDDNFYHFLFAEDYIVHYGIKPVIFTKTAKINPISTKTKKKQYSTETYINNLEALFRYEYNK